MPRINGLVAGGGCPRVARAGDDRRSDPNGHGEDRVGVEAVADAGWPEHSCHEGNQAIELMLRGARAQEKATLEAAKEK